MFWVQLRTLDLGTLGLSVIWPLTATIVYASMHVGSSLKTSHSEDAAASSFHFPRCHHVILYIVLTPAQPMYVSWGVGYYLLHLTFAQGFKATLNMLMVFCFKFSPSQGSAHMCSWYSVVNVAAGHQMPSHCMNLAHQTSGVPNNVYARVDPWHDEKECRKHGLCLLLFKLIHYLSWSIMSRICFSLFKQSQHVHFSNCYHKSQHAPHHYMYLWPTPAPVYCKQTRITAQHTHKQTNK